jgi:cytokinin dehydrogenase
MSAPLSVRQPEVADVAIDTSAPALAEAGRDFGGLAQGTVTGVVTPRTALEVQAAVRAAIATGEKLTPRGQGMSQSGQSVPRRGKSLDLRKLDAVGEPNLEANTISVEPGATWRQVLARLAPRGLRPPVMPLNLDLSVGGTLSAGGFGSTSFRHGVAAGNVARLEVVTGQGDLVVTSPHDRPEVFGAVLGGLGRVGVIVRAELELVRALPRTRTLYLLHDSPMKLLKDMVRLSARSDVHHLEGFCAGSVQGLALAPNGKREPFVHWQYGLHVSCEVDRPATLPTPSHLVEGLSEPKLLRVEEDDTFAFAGRYDARFEMMRKTGGWNQLHPWFECLLPLERATDLIPQILARLPVFLGDGHRIFLLPQGGHPAAMAFPEGDPVVGFAILPVGVPEPLREPALAALRSVHELVLGAGGKRYASGWLFDMGEAEWRAHHAGQFGALTAAKAALDPHGVFESCLSNPCARPNTL